ncbi:uncharacterized protein AMSG_08580 [Thecamonas trahens ATCC 50062]|uniref:N-acetyltransferase domain-containing protein n=1 Tax=Thecamonas trahens ATCC 50062 TaxID=461836 RepID=A0A0L0DK92_THETB|nr:hypothetical protein AMSG_08580 [Thecamonas trahens ATCC 50062]KNC52702.1 hypothetical protein AMSG_08580 [Thecamonas trahens ATCC 50062]|eukprot:XP_013755022.1 hypothetical protein AMSG_08580 [Thecamonas trahens ATCC 50062]
MAASQPRPSELGRAELFSGTPRFLLSVEKGPSAELVAQVRGELASGASGVAAYVTTNKSKKTHFGVFVLRNSITLAGLTGYLDEVSGKAKIDVLYVDDDLRGRGVGTLLVNAFERAVVDAGGSKISLVSLSYQAPAFYERLGYRRCHAQTGWPASASNVWLEKDLEASPPPEASAAEVLGDDVTFELQSPPDEAAAAAVADGLQAHNIGVWETLGYPPGAPPGTGPAILVTARRGDKLLGALHGNRLFDLFAVSAWVVVESERRNGVGTALVGALRDELRSGSSIDRTRMITVTLPHALASDATQAALKAAQFVPVYDDGDGMLWEGRPVGALDTLTEVDSMHRFFTAWANGEIPKSPENIEYLTSRMVDAFVIVRPNGAAYSKSQLTKLVLDEYGQAAAAPIDIQLRSIAVRRACRCYDAWLVVYENWRVPRAASSEDQGFGCRTSALLSFDVASGTTVWEHIHRTALQKAPAPQTL